MTTMNKERVSKIKFASVDDDVDVWSSIEIDPLIEEAVADVGYILCEYEGSKKDYEEWMEEVRFKDIFEYELVVSTKVELRKVGKVKKETVFVRESFDK